MEVVGTCWDGMLRLLRRFKTNDKIEMPCLLFDELRERMRIVVVRGSRALNIVEKRSHQAHKKW